MTTGLATVTRNALPEASYGYDALRRRVLKTAGHDPPLPPRPGRTQDIDRVTPEGGGPNYVGGM